MSNIFQAKLKYHNNHIMYKKFYAGNINVTLHMMLKKVISFHSKKYRFGRAAECFILSNYEIKRGSLSDLIIFLSENHYFVFELYESVRSDKLPL